MSERTALFIVDTEADAIADSKKHPVLYCTKSACPVENHQVSVCCDLLSAYTVCGRWKELADQNPNVEELRIQLKSNQNEESVRILLQKWRNTLTMLSMESVIQTSVVIPMNGLPSLHEITCQTIDSKSLDILFKHSINLRNIRCHVVSKSSGVIDWKSIPPGVNFICPHYCSLTDDPAITSGQPVLNLDTILSSCEALVACAGETMTGKNGFDEYRKSVRDGKSFLFKLETLANYDVQSIVMQTKQSLTHVRIVNATITEIGLNEFTKADKLQVIVVSMLTSGGKHISLPNIRKFVHTIFSSNKSLQRFEIYDTLLIPDEEQKHLIELQVDASIAIFSLHHLCGTWSMITSPHGMDVKVDGLMFRRVDNLNQDERPILPRITTPAPVTVCPAAAVPKKPEPKKSSSSQKFNQPDEPAAKSGVCRGICKPDEDKPVVSKEPAASTADEPKDQPPASSDRPPASDVPQKAEDPIYEEIPPQECQPSSSSSKPVPEDKPADEEKQQPPQKRPPPGRPLPPVPQDQPAADEPVKQYTEVTSDSGSSDSESSDSDGENLIKPDEVNQVMDPSTDSSEDEPDYVPMESAPPHSPGRPLPAEPDEDTGSEYLEPDHPYEEVKSAEEIPEKTDEPAASDTLPAQQPDDVKSESEAPDEAAAAAVPPEQPASELPKTKSKPIPDDAKSDETCGSGFQSEPETVFSNPDTKSESDGESAAPTDDAATTAAPADEDAPVCEPPVKEHESVKPLPSETGSDNSVPEPEKPVPSDEKETRPFQRPEPVKPHAEPADKKKEQPQPKQDTPVVVPEPSEGSESVEPETEKAEDEKKPPVTENKPEDSSGSDGSEPRPDESDSASSGSDGVPAQPEHQPPAEPDSSGSSPNSSDEDQPAVCDKPAPVPKHDQRPEAIPEPKSQPHHKPEPVKPHAKPDADRNNQQPQHRHDIPVIEPEPSEGSVEPEQQKPESSHTQHPPHPSHEARPGHSKPPVEKQQKPVKPETKSNETSAEEPDEQEEAVPVVDLPPTTPSGSIVPASQLLGTPSSGPSSSGGHHPAADAHPHAPQSPDTTRRRLNQLLALIPRFVFSCKCHKNQ